MWYSDNPFTAFDRVEHCQTNSIDVNVAIAMEEFSTQPDFFNKVIFLDIYNLGLVLIT